MHPPAGGSRAVAQPFSLSRLLFVLPRRFTRATATGVMLPTHGSSLRYSAAFPALLLLLLSLYGNTSASSFTTPCIAGSTYWDTTRQNCVPCTRCEPSEALLVVVPCQPHKDTKCGNFSSIGIDWSWMKNTHPKSQKRLRAQYQRPWPTPIVQKAPGPTPRTATNRRPQRPRTPVSRGLVSESAVRVMETREQESVAEKRVVLSPVREEEPWTWQYWLGTGCALLVLVSATLFLALLVLKRTRRWLGYGTSSKSRMSERRKGQFIRSEKADYSTAKGEFVDRLDSDKCSLVMDEILLDKEKAAATGSLRDESENLYVKAPASSTVVTMIPGKSSVKVEVQGGDVHRSLAENCLKFGCASRTEFTERSSAV